MGKDRKRKRNDESGKRKNVKNVTREKGKDRKRKRNDESGKRRRRPTRRRRKQRRNVADETRKTTRIGNNKDDF